MSSVTVSQDDTSAVVLPELSNVEVLDGASNESAAPASDNLGSVNDQSDGSSSVREIYKNSWLKQIPCTEKWAGRIYKTQKPEKFWVVFCVHDEKDAFLEFYENRRSAYSHSPLSSIPLSQCLHISPTIVVQENDHEFAVTLQTQVIRLAASTREQMVEWMDTLKNKLRELGILEPKDNLYSKEPIMSPRSSALSSPSEPSISSQEGSETSQSGHNPDLSRLSLRDPNSPLPPVPLNVTQTTTVRCEAISLSSVVYIRNPPAIQPSFSRTQTSVSHDDVQNADAATDLSLVSMPAQRSERSTLETVFVADSSQNSQLQNSSSNTNIPINTIDNSLYEPLFCTASWDQNMQLTGVAIRNPSYENPPDFQRLSYSEPSPPVLPPRPTNISRRSSAGASEMFPSLRSSTSGNSSTSLHNSESALHGASQNPVINLAHANHRLSNATEMQLTISPERLLSIQDAAPTRIESEQNSNMPSSSHQRNSLSSPPNSPFLTDENGRVLSLRETQVLRLQTEILHKSGIRLLLRKKDCISAIAFVECFGCVWIAGWKQKEHPLLHNAFHIGDRVLSIAGHRVHNIQEALKVIKNQHTIVEYVVRRTPYAKVLAIKREYEGQDLGIAREGGTAEIKEVKPGSLALRHGLPPKAPSIDGAGVCNWFLTEINHRPLNLFFKDNEIHDRLNAVGLDISVLAQPLDFIKVLKKQLKAIRGYKDYTLQ